MPKSYHRDNGQFSKATERHGFVDRNRGESDKLSEKVEFRITSLDYRKAQILFDQHRKVFGWEVRADMWRDLLLIGAGEYVKRVPNPSPEMLRLQRMAEELDEFMAGAMKHVRLTELCEQLDQCVQRAIEVGDLGMVRKFLAKFKLSTDKETDTMVKERRAEYFDRKWSRLWDSLNRGISLDPSRFTKD